MASAASRSPHRNLCSSPKSERALGAGGTWMNTAGQSGRSTVGCVLTQYLVWPAHSDLRRCPTTRRRRTSGPARRVTPGAPIHRPGAPGMHPDADIQAVSGPLLLSSHLDKPASLHLARSGAPDGKGHRTCRGIQVSCMAGACGRRARRSPVQHPEAEYQTSFLRRAT